MSPNTQDEEYRMNAHPNTEADENVKTATMKAAIHTQYGTPDVLHVRQVPLPVPKGDELLVQVRASTVNSGDWRMRKADPFLVRFMNGLTKPRRQILGSDFSGIVAAVGKSVTEFNVGDEVFGSTETRLGTNAEYVTIGQRQSVVHKPVTITHEDAAAIPFGASTSLFFLKEEGNIRPGDRVLINGASGALGVYGIQLAKYFGADVTAVCSTKNLELVRSLGADAVADYTNDDVPPKGLVYDLIYDTVGTLVFGQIKDSLKPGGILLAAAGTGKDWLLMARTALGGTRKVVTAVAMSRKDQLIFLREMLAAGTLRAVIDRRFSLDQIADAHRYVEQGHKRGSVVITL